MSEAGREQALKAAERLKREKLAAVYASPRERAQATAAVIASASRVPVETEAALDEIDFGGWTGSSFADLDGRADWDAWNSRRSEARPPDGETMAQAAGRALDFAARARALHPGRAVALVSHADIIRGMIAQLLGLSFDNMLRFDIDPASISTLAANDAGVRLIALNERTAA